MRRLVRFPDWIGTVALTAPHPAMIAWGNSAVGLLGLSLVLSLHLVVAAPARGEIAQWLHANQFGTALRLHGNQFPTVT